MRKVPISWMGHFSVVAMVPTLKATVYLVVRNSYQELVFFRGKGQMFYCIVLVKGGILLNKIKKQRTIFRTESKRLPTNHLKRITF